MEWDKLVVGKRVCKPGAPVGCHFDIFPFGLFLMVRINEPKGSQIRDYAHGQARCRAIMVDGYFVFLHQFGMSSWRSAIFHMAKAQHKHIPPVLLKTGLPLHVILVDAQTGILKTKRVIQLDSRLAHKIYYLLESQDPEDPLLAYDIQVRRITQKYTDHQLVALSTLRWNIGKK